MASRYWMITNRALVKRGSKTTLGKDEGDLAYFTKPIDDGKDIRNLASWRSASGERFKEALAGVAEQFPRVRDWEHEEEQQHVTLFVHGYNNSWEDAAGRYEKLVRDLYVGPEGMGECILFTWPSDGSPAGYLPDRRDARASAEELANVLSALYDWMLEKQERCIARPNEACRAKVSVIAHSMGNYVLQSAMHWVWTRKNQPLLVSLVNQLLMVAADVDNDLFKDGENVGDLPGEGIANLCYRVTALYSGRDSVLGMSAGLKHFGKRRLGRSGFDRKYRLPDNVWDTDCSTYFARREKNIHSAYFDTQKTVELMRQILRGVDRGVLVEEGYAVPDRSVPVTAAPTTEHELV